MCEEESETVPLEIRVLRNLRRVVVDPAESESRGEGEQRTDQHACQGKQFGAGQRGNRFWRFELGHIESARQFQFCNSSCVSGIDFRSAFQITISTLSLCLTLLSPCRLIVMWRGRGRCLPISTPIRRPSPRRRRRSLREAGKWWGIATR